MKILIVHNHYQQYGGEDTVFAAETGLLRHYGHEVMEYKDDNHRISEIGRFSSALQTIWSRHSQRKLLSVLRDFRPDIAHFHNTFLLISPSVYYTCQDLSVPVVQTLHNYRLLCPTASFYRDGHVCEDCLGKTVPWPGVLHGCYRNSRVQTALVAAMLVFHRSLRTWQRQVDMFITLSEFTRRHFVASGIPSEKIVVKPNFVFPDPGASEGDRGYVFFAGRLSPVKGINTLLKAWVSLKGIPLRMAGDGPLMEEAKMFVKIHKLENVEILGQCANEEVIALIKDARFVVLSSENYENFPMIIAEAFACGVPIIASRLGAMAEIVENGQTGLHFEPGNPKDLAAKVEWAWTHTKEMQEMGRKARARYEAKYTAGQNYKMLMDIYQIVCERRKHR